MKPKINPNDQLQIIERSYCDCSKCELACRTMPGSLAPGDLQRIASHLHRECDEKFVKQNFAASDGAIVMTPDGMMQIPTIVPQQDGEGNCVFLTKQGQCSIHPVAPYGCRNFTVCGKGQTREEANYRCGLQLNAILAEPGHGYVATWAMLEKEGVKASPVVERRGRLERGLERMRESERAGKGQGGREENA